MVPPAYSRSSARLSPAYTVIITTALGLLWALAACTSAFRVSDLPTQDMEPHQVIEEADENSYESLYRKTENFYTEGRYNEALDIIYSIHEENPQAPVKPELLLLQAKIALMRNEKFKARLYLKKIIQHIDEIDLRIESLVHLGNLYYQEGEYEEAYNYYLETVNRQRFASAAGESFNLYKKHKRFPLETFESYRAWSGVWLRLAEISLYYRSNHELARSQLENIRFETLTIEEKKLYYSIKKRLEWQIITPEIFGLNDGNISALAVDDDDLWIGTWNGGIARYSQGSRESTVFIQGKESLVANTVRCIEITDERVWIGTYRGLFVYSKSSSYWQEIKHFSQNNSNPDRIEDIKYVAGTIFVGTLGRGLWRYSNKQWQSISHNGLPGKFINCLELIDKHLFIGTMNLGVVIFDLQSDTLKNFDTVNNNFKSRNITMILYDYPEVWIGTYGNGLYRWSCDSNQLSHLSKEAGIISDNWILCGVRAKSGLYFGTFGGGVNAFDKESEQWRVIGLREGLSSLDISASCYSPPLIYFGTLGCGVTVHYEDRNSL